MYGYDGSSLQCMGMMGLVLNGYDGSSQCMGMMGPVSFHNCLRESTGRRLANIIAW